MSIFQKLTYNTTLFKAKVKSESFQRKHCARVAKRIIFYVELGLSGHRWWKNHAWNSPMFSVSRYHFPHLFKVCTDTKYSKFKERPVYYRKGYLYPGAQENIGYLISAVMVKSNGQPVYSAIILTASTSSCFRKCKPNVSFICLYFLLPHWRALPVYSPITIE